MLKPTCHGYTLEVMKGFTEWIEYLETPGSFKPSVVIGPLHYAMPKLLNCLEHLDLFVGVEIHQYCYFNSPSQITCSIDKVKLEFTTTPGDWLGIPTEHLVLKCLNFEESGWRRMKNHSPNPHVKKLEWLEESDGVCIAVARKLFPNVKDMDFPHVSIPVFLSLEKVERLRIANISYGIYMLLLKSIPTSMTLIIGVVYGSNTDKYLLPNCEYDIHFVEGDDEGVYIHKTSVSLTTLEELSV